MYGIIGIWFCYCKDFIILKQLSSLLENKNLLHPGYSSIVGIIMVGVGLLLAIMAFIQFRKNRDKNNYYYSSKLYMREIFSMDNK